MALKTIKATVKGVEYDLTLNESTGYYEATIPAGSDSSFLEDGGYFSASLTATDDSDLSTTVDATHSTYGENLRLYVTEANKPTVTVVSPASGAYITNTTKPEIQFKLLDNTVQSSGYSGINAESTVLTVGGNTVSVSDITFTETQGGYIGTYTPAESLSDGECVVTVSVSDNDGNTADTVSVAFRIDNLAPELNVTSPADGYVTSKADLVVSGTTNDANTPVTVEIFLNGTSKGEAEVTGGSFSKTITLDQEGENIVKVVATDASGRATTIERTIKFNTTAPVFTDVGIIYNGSQVSAGNKVPAGATYTIRCKVTTS